MQGAVIRTEPLTIKRLALLFSVSRNKMPALLRTIEGVEKVGGMYRVPAGRMPPAYWIEKRWPIPGLSNGNVKLAQICTTHLERSEIANKVGS